MTRYLMSLILSTLMTVATAGNRSAADFVRNLHSAPGKKLTVDLRCGGDVLITGAAGDEVNVKVRLTGPDGDDIDVTAEETSSGVDIRAEYDGDRRHYNGSADVEVTVPSRYDVEVETMGGQVTIKEVDGRFSGRTMGGEITLSNLKGNVDLTTMGGEIEVSNSDLDGEVKTMGGDVVLRNVSGNVQGSTMGGDVLQEGSRPSSPGSSSSGAGEKRIHSMGGDLNVDTAPNGASLETMGGDVHVGSASDHVKVKTMGGDIQIDAVDGWADLTTMGGDVTMRMTGDPSRGKRDVEISSMGGDIELTLPEGISATFDLETEYTRDGFRAPKIVSDFPVQVSESSDCEYHHDAPCKVLTGTGKTGSGANRIKIHTIQGDIIIKKS